MHTLRGKCHPAAIFIWCFAICARDLSGPWHFAHPKSPQACASHGNILLCKFKADHFQRQDWSVDYPECIK